MPNSWWIKNRYRRTLTTAPGLGRAKSPVTASVNWRSLLSATVNFRLGSGLTEQGRCRR